MAFSLSIKKVEPRYYTLLDVTIYVEPNIRR